MATSKSSKNNRAARKRDALALAELIYDMYKEEQRKKDIMKDNHV